MYLRKREIRNVIKDRYAHILLITVAVSITTAIENKKGKTTDEKADSFPEQTVNSFYTNNYNNK